MPQVLWYIAAGLLAGVSAGIFGIGGGVVLVPFLTLVTGMDQHMANGTSLVALLAPVGILGAMEYYKAGKIGEVQIKAGLIIAVGIFLGAYFGSLIAVNLPSTVLRKAFSIFLIAVAVKLWLNA